MNGCPRKDTKEHEEFKTGRGEGHFLNETPAHVAFSFKTLAS